MWFVCVSFGSKTWVKKVWYNVNWKTVMQKCANDPNTSSTVKTYVQWDKRETSQNINNIFGKIIMGGIFNTIQYFPIFI